MKLAFKNKHQLDTNGEGNGTPLQHSYLENPMDGGVWHGLAIVRHDLATKPPLPLPPYLWFHIWGFNQLQIT